MFLSNFGLTLNLQAQYPTVELIYVSDDFAFLESMPFFGRRGAFHWEVLWAMAACLENVLHSIPTVYSYMLLD